MSKRQISMRPQDVVILLKKTTPAGMAMTGKQLADSLGISQSEVSESLERSRVSGLLDDATKRVNTQALKDFLIYGLKYVFPVVPTGIVRGMPTGISASPIKERIPSGGESYVWPSAKGTLRGQAVQPLYSSVPEAADRDASLYALLVAADTLRLGRIREKEMAKDYLETQFLNYAKQ